jgi:hypothetical protein
MRVHHQWAVLAFALLATIACGADSTAPKLTAPDGLFWSISLSHRAVTLSTRTPHDTLQLTVVARSATGAPLDNATIQFRVGDGADTTVFVSPTGLLQGHAFARSVRVLVTVSQGGMTQYDTVLVKVDTAAVANPGQPLQSFSIRPADNTQLLLECAENASLNLPLTVVDANGQSVSNLPVFYASAQHEIANVTTKGMGSLVGSPFNGIVYPNCAGPHVGESVWFYATTTIYGVTYTDSVEFTSTMPTFAGIIILPDESSGSSDITFSPQHVTVAAGGAVAWIPATAPGQQLDVVFDAPQQIAETTDTLFIMSFGVFPPSGVGGNISPWSVDPDIPGWDQQYVPVNARTRRFPVPGRYQFRSAKYPKATGTITVVAPQQN